jgi:predicted nucleotidyltransferase
LKTLQEILAILHMNLPELNDEYNVTAIGVFGSVARGDQIAACDVDILVDLQPHVGWEVVHLQMRLEELLGLKVDLVTRKAAMRKPLLWHSIEEDLVYV